MNKPLLNALIRTACVILIGSGAVAGEVSAPYQVGSDNFRIEFSPHWSDELGLSMQGAAGTRLTDAAALGLLVEYGQYKREYLANAGLQLTDKFSLVGSAGKLEEQNQYFDDEGRNSVEQMEYGISLKTAYEAGMFSGLEFNGYMADAKAGNDSLETGKLQGLQLLTGMSLPDSTHIKLGGGYEWLSWDGGEDDDGLTFSASGSRALSDTLNLNGNVKLGASEDVYGGGLAMDISNGGSNNSMLGVNYSHIDGHNGIGDDRRVELNWSLAFASPRSANAAATTGKAGKPADVLLADVMQRPAYLPKRVVARVKAETCEYHYSSFNHYGIGYGTPSYMDIAPLLSDFVGGVSPSVIYVRLDGNLYPLTHDNGFYGPNPGYYNSLPRPPDHFGDTIIICGTEVPVPPS